MQAMNNHTLWETTDSKKVWAGYLFRYASEINKNKDLFVSYTLKDPTKLNVYMFQEEMAAEEMPHIDEVRCSCFGTGVGVIEFWVSYSGWSAEKIANFSYMFKKATSKCNKELPDHQRALYDVAKRTKVTAVFFVVCPI